VVREETFAGAGLRCGSFFGFAVFFLRAGKPEELPRFILPPLRRLVRASFPELR